MKSSSSHPSPTSKSLADPRRDRTHGRIWRVVYRGEKADAPTPVVPDLAKLNAKALIETLGDANITTRTLATNELVERVGKEATPDIKVTIKPVRMRKETLTGFAGEKMNLEMPEWKTMPTARVSSLWALERMGALDAAEIDTLLADEREIQTHTLTMLGLRTPAPTTETALTNLGVEYPDRMISRAGASAIARLAESGGFDEGAELAVMYLARSLDRESEGDAMNVHASKVALRELLLHPRNFEFARTFADENAEFAERIANVCLAVQNSDSATFLLAHLQRTKFVTPRAGEYLRHAVLHLPEEKLGDVSALLQSLADAPLAQRLALADGLGQAARERGWKLPDELAVWTQRTLLTALDDNALADRAIAALRDATWPEKFAPLQQIVLDPKRDGSRRAAALEAALNLDRGIALAAQALTDPTSLPLRKKAAELLGRSPSDTARTALLAALPTAPTELALAITASLAKTDPDFTALLDLLEAGKASPALLRNRLIAILITQRAEALRVRADALTKSLPPEDARLDGVIAARVKAFAIAKPDAARGAQVFAQQCAVCHRFRDQGGNVGPNLDGVAARGAHRLIEDILDPNRNVDPTFRQTTLELADGRILIGVNLREEGDAVLLTDAAGQTQSAPKTNVKSQTQSRLSLMPPGFETTIPTDDFNALLAYLLR